MALLSGRRFFPERYETLLVHGSLPAGEASAEHLLEREGAHGRHLPALSPALVPPRDARALAGLRSIIRSFRPQIVHTHTAKAGFLGRQAALLASRRNERPLIVHTFHGHVLEGYFGSAQATLYRRLEQRLARSTDVLVGVSEATIDDLVRLGVASREKFRHVPLGLDLAPVAAAGEDEDLRGRVRAELGLDVDDVACLFVGRLAPIKRLDVLLRALAVARAQERSLRLLVVGDGEERARLKALAGSLGLEGSVHWLGYRADPAPFYAASDLAVLSSDNEGTPVSLIEAAAAGRPAVAIAVGGVGEVVTEETGVLVSRGNGPAFGAALAALAADPQRRRALAAAARERALARFSAERLFEEVNEIYGEGFLRLRS